MTFTVGFKHQFAQEFARFPQDQQDLILDFIALYKANGLSDFNKFPGKIAPSWSGLVPTQANYQYAQKHDLWHYHIGYPVYIAGPKYQTSDWLLHFQWVARGSHIDLVDCYSHYTSAGAFHMPAPIYVSPPPAAPSPSGGSDST